MGRRRDYSKIHADKFKDDAESRKSYKDERFWVLTKNGDGVGSAIIRFLPNKDIDEVPFVLGYKHSIYINKKGFIDNCPTTIGKDCPICDSNKDKQGTYVLDNGTYRKKGWVCNILVIEDKANRENEGKVFLYEYKTQVHDVLQEALVPDKELNIDPLYYYSLDDGANFRLLVRPGKQYPTWSKSKFMEPSSIDEELEKFGIDDDYLEEHSYDIDKVVKSKAFKSYDDLLVKYNKYMKNVNMAEVELDSKAESNEKENVETYTRTKRKASKTEKEAKSEEPESEKKTEKETKTPRRAPKAKKGVSEKGKQNMQSYFNSADDE